MVAASAGVISWGIEEVGLRAWDPIGRIPRGNASQPAFTAMMRQKIQEATTRTAMLSYGALGGLLGLGLGLCGGRLRGSWPRGVAAGALGLVVGGAAGAALSGELVPRYYAAIAADRARFEDDLTFPLLIHLGMWASAGVAAGLAVGVGMGSWGRGALAVLGGLLGAALGTALYEFVSALAFPMAETNLPISKERGARLLAHLAVAVVAAAGAWGAAQSLKLTRKSAAAATAPTGTMGRDAGGPIPA
jgi:hypothetical protein